MALSKEQVLEGLAKVAAPDGTPLPQTGTLSEVVISDGKVFFSINVDAAAVKAWEPVRKHAEEAVRAVPGVASVLIALTAERAGGASGRGPQGSPMARGHAAPGRAAGPAAPQAAQAPPGVEAI
ncbi:MAG: iron-sulfur cluster assembly protein, partial [Xanthobacteraceae bacterium]